MPILAKLTGVVLSGQDQLLLEQQLDGAYVEAVVMAVTGAQAASGFATFYEPLVGEAPTLLVNNSTVIAVGAAGRIDVERAIEALKVTATKSAGGDTVITLWVLGAGSSGAV